MANRKANTPQENEIMPAKKLTLSNQGFWVGKGVRALIALSVLGVVEPAKADVPDITEAEESSLIQEDPYYEKIKSGLPLMQKQVRDKMKEVRTSAELSENEKGWMKQSQEAIRRHYMQLSFWLYVTARSKDKEVAEAMETVLENGEKLSYKEKNGVITITKRPLPNSSIPENLKIELQNGILTCVNDFELNHEAFRKFEKEWEEVAKKIKEINLKVLSSPDKLSKEDWKWFEFFSMKLPRRVKKLLELKGNQRSTKENNVLGILQSLIDTRQHPNSVEEMFSGKKLNLFTIIKPGEESPKGTFEIAYSATTPALAFEAFGRFSNEGILIE